MEQDTGAYALEYASFWRRFAAFAVDAVLLSIIISMIFPIHGRDLFQWFSGSHRYLVPLVSISNFLSTLVTLAYSVVFWSWRGQTPGKLLLNIKVLRGDGSNISFSYALLRYLGYIICALTLGLGFIGIICDNRKQGLHDKIAGTVVIKIPEPARTDNALTEPRPSTG
ncbi:MAG: RDD family protein [Dehalococcoidia bacterium]|nr:RDD family protein [Dehalococcoidia bacterium]